MLNICQIAVEVEVEVEFSGNVLVIIFDVDKLECQSLILSGVSDGGGFK